MKKRSIVDSILALFAFGYGHARYVVNDAGELEHQATVISVRMQPRETIEAFLVRLKAEYGWRPGDTLEIVSNGGRLDVAKITFQPR